MKICSTLTEGADDERILADMSPLVPAVDTAVPQPAVGEHLNEVNSDGVIYAKKSDPPEVPIDLPEEPLMDHYSSQNEHGDVNAGMRN